MCQVTGALIPLPLKLVWGGDLTKFLAILYNGCDRSMLKTILRRLPMADSTRANGDI